MGVWGMPSFVRHPSSVVVKPETRVYVKNQAESRKKNETADDGGGCVSPRPTARYPNPRPRRQFGKVPLSVGVEIVSSQAIISTMVAPSHRNEV